MDKDTRIDDWYLREPKNKAVYALLQYLMKHPKEGIDLVGDDNGAKNLLQREGGIAVPTNKGARVIFFAPDEGEIYGGDGRLGVGSSVIIRVPPEGVSTSLTDLELKKLCLLGNYPYWPPNSSSPPFQFR
jgi:hypothetical protein